MGKLEKVAAGAQILYIKQVHALIIGWYDYSADFFGKEILPLPTPLSFDEWCPKGGLVGINQTDIVTSTCRTSPTFLLTDKMMLKIILNTNNIA